MGKYTIGIDTGGTCTDAVLVDSQTKKVLAAAKRPTTHHDLSVGIREALAQLLQTTESTSKQIEALAVSTTLATNSVVENTGARVVLLVIGFVKHFRLPVKALVFVDGGHTIDGKEEQPLDIENIVDVVSRLRGEVDAYGICSAMSMHNPSHELVAERAIQMIDPKPVFCSHRVSSTAGMRERAATAGLHAKLMPVMHAFVDGVQQSMKDLGLDCPMMIISGNAKTIDPAAVVEFAGMTVASGPACSAFFGAQHTDKECIVVDVGGTTTDIAYISSGKPQLSPQGCIVGDWHTHVETVDMQTGGIGGDSFARIDEHGVLQLGPGRVVPLAMTKDLPEVEKWLGKGDTGKIILPRVGQHLENGDNQLMDVLQTYGHATPADFRRAIGLGGIPLDQGLEELVREQCVVVAGFTPTDALHVLGKLDFGKQDIALRAAARLGGELRLTAEDFSEKVVALAEEQIENLILDYIIQRKWGNSLASFLAGCRNNSMLDVDFSLKIPIIGIGAAAPVLLPKVAERLRTEIFFPENCGVGNAIGAALIYIDACQGER